MRASFSIAVLVSGAGTNLQALIDTVHGREGVEIVAVASNKAGAQGLARAEKAGIETGVFPAGEYSDRAERDAAIAGWLTERGVQLVVMAGFMELITRALLTAFPERIVNVHPALLPAFPGVRAIERQLEEGVKVGGVTVHFVDEGVDSGPIILQEAVEVPYTRDSGEFESCLHETEHRLLPRAVRLLAAGAVSIDKEKPRIVNVDGSAFGD